MSLMVNESQRMEHCLIEISKQLEGIKNSITDMTAAKENIKLKQKNSYLEEALRNIEYILDDYYKNGLPLNADKIIEGDLSLRTIVKQQIGYYSEFYKK